jgi:hypothetical protein
MNPIFITVKNAFTALAASRPFSHAAAVTLLGTSIYAVHEGATATLPVGLASATTAALIGAEWLQWTALGRMARIEDAGDQVRALVLRGQCAGVGALQVGLYTMAVLNYAHAAGLDWSHGWALAGTIAAAALFAALNFVAKWTSCDQVDGRRPPSVRLHNAIFSEPVAAMPALQAPAVEAGCDDVGVIRLEDRIRRHEKMVDADALAKATAGRSADERLQLFIKRAQTRRRRESKRAA